MKISLGVTAVSSQVITDHQLVSADLWSLYDHWLLLSVPALLATVKLTRPAPCPGGAARPMPVYPGQQQLCAGWPGPGPDKAQTTNLLL